MQTVDLFNLRCPICGFPLKPEFNKNYGLNLWLCTNDAEVCNFMINNRVHKHDIYKFSKCAEDSKPAPKAGENLKQVLAGARSTIPTRNSIG